MLKNNIENIVDINKVTEEAKKADNIGYGLYKINDKNKSPFTQSINENHHILISKKYLTTAEWVVLGHLQTLCELHTNAIVSPKNKQFMNISELAEFMGKERQTMSSTINSLLKKGLIYEFVNVQEIKEHKRPVTQRPLFMNPELYYAGDKNRVNSVLCKLCIMSDIIEKKGIKLEWKLWHISGNEYGKLVKRKTYLKYKKVNYYKKS